MVGEVMTGAAEVRRRDPEWRGVKKEEYASPSADTKARQGVPSDSDSLESNPK